MQDKPAFRLLDLSRAFLNGQHLHSLASPGKNSETMACIITISKRGLTSGARLFSNLALAVPWDRACPNPTPACGTPSPPASSGRVRSDRASAGGGVPASSGGAAAEACGCFPKPGGEGRSGGAAAPLLPGWLVPGEMYHSVCQKSFFSLGTIRQTSTGFPEALHSSLFARANSQMNFAPTHQEYCRK